MVWNVTSWNGHDPDSIDIEGKVISLVADITGAAADAIKRNMTLADLGVDSLAIIDLGANLPSPADKAVENGELEKVDLSVADIGINIALKSDEAVAFGTSWVAELQYQAEA